MKTYVNFMNDVAKLMTFFHMPHLVSIYIQLPKLCLYKCTFNLK